MKKCEKCSKNLHPDCAKLDVNDGETDTSRILCNSCILDKPNLNTNKELSSTAEQVKDLEDAINDIED